MANKSNKKTPVSVFVFWLLLAIIGVGLLFTGLQNSVLGDSLSTSAMLIIIGIALIFVGLIMVLGKANIETEDITMPEEEKK